jgi:hypothetical protein
MRKQRNAKKAKPRRFAVVPPGIAWTASVPGSSSKLYVRKRGPSFVAASVVGVVVQLLNPIRWLSRKSHSATGTVMHLSEDMISRVRLMDGYTRWPVWVGLDGPGEPPEWNLPVQLRESLFAWGDEFMKHFDTTRGWDDEQTHHAHRQSGAVLAAELQKYVGDMRVELHTLPLE